MSSPARSLLAAACFAVLSCSDQDIGTNNSPPSAAILEPAPEFEVLEGEAVLLRGEVQDANTPVDELDVQWSSSQDGVLLESSPDGDGLTTHRAEGFATGEHTITLRVIDAAGASDSDAVRIVVRAPDVPNTNPTCAITSPSDGSEFIEGDTILFEGTANDEESDPTELTATWSSSEDDDMDVVTPSTSGRIALPVDDLTVGTHVVTLDVADPEGGNCSEFVVVTVSSGNARPSIGAPSISPDPIFTTDEATCSAPPATDPEGDPLQVELRWWVDGNDSGVTGSTLAASSFVKGETLVCEATASDAGGPGTAAPSLAVVVADTPPTAPTAVIAPPAPVEDTDGLLCSEDAPSSDADSDPISYAATWTLDGAAFTGTTTTTTWLDDTVAVGDAVAGDWVCTLTPIADGVAGPGATASVTVAPANQRPTIGAPTMSPSTLFTDTGASCVAPPPVDPEGDAVSLTWGWTVNGAPAGAAVDSLASTEFIKGQSVACTVTPADAGGPGTPGVATAVVQDSPPTQPGVSITSSGTTPGTQLTCTLSSISTDADTDPITYDVDWTLDGNPWTGATTTTTLTDDTVPGSSVVAGTWACTITPTAAGVAGPSGSDQVTVNALPAGKLVFLTSVTTNGAFGGVGGGDAFCQTRADAAGLPGTYMAWVSGSTYGSSPAARFTRSFNDPYVLVSGAVVATDWNDLTDGNIGTPITLDEFGNSAGWFAYSFTQTDGSNGLFGSASSSCYGQNCHCDDWTNSSQSAPNGSAVADTGRTNDDWTDYSFGNFCNQQFRLMCFQQ